MRPTEAAGDPLGGSVGRHLPEARDTRVDRPSTPHGRTGHALPRGGVSELRSVAAFTEDGKFNRIHEAGINRRDFVSYPPLVGLV